MKKLLILVLSIWLSCFAASAQEPEIVPVTDKKAKKILNSRLVVAVAKGDTTSAGKMLRQGADPNAQDEKGRAVLLKAIMLDDEAMTTLLLANGADPNRKDEKGSFPLDLAATWGRPQIVERLLAKGGDPNKTDDGHPPLIGASFGLLFTSVPPTIYERFFNEDNSDEDNEDEENASWLTRKLFRKRTPGDYLATIRLLLQHGADINRVADCEYGETVLGLAAATGDVAIVNEMLARGAKPGENFSSFMFDERDIKRILQIEELQLPALSRHQQALLDWAKGKVTAFEIIRNLLAQAGAKFTSDENDYQLDAEDIAHDTFEDAIETKDLEDFTRLAAAYGQHEKYAGVLSQTLRSTIIGCHSEMTKELLKQKIVINWAGPDGETALMFAAQQGDVETVQLLLDAGANVHLKDAQNHTALYHAQRRADKHEGNKKVVELLKKHGAIE